MKFITTEEILEYEKKMITKPNEFLYIFSPYLQIKEEIKKILEYTNIKITIICGKTKLYENEYNKLKELMKNAPNIELLYNPNLHAKIMINETYALISSMNLYEASENNHEAGIYFSNQYFSEKAQFSNLMKFCKQILDAKDTCVYTDELHRTLSQKNNRSSIQNNHSNSLTDGNFSWLQQQSVKLHKKWQELENDIINQAKTSFYEPTTITVDNCSYNCKNGVVEGFKNAIHHINELITENDKLREKLKMKITS